MGLYGAGQASSQLGAAGISELGHQQAKRSPARHPTGPQLPRRLVALESQLRDGRLHARGGIGGHARLAVEDAGNGLRADARRPRHVPQRRPLGAV